MNSGVDVEMGDFSRVRRVDGNCVRYQHFAGSLHGAGNCSFHIVTLYRRKGLFTPRESGKDQRTNETDKEYEQQTSETIFAFVFARCE